jgi:hypothetical protein
MTKRFPWYMVALAALIGVAMLLLAAGPAEGAEHYIRAGATGTADGSDWTNAWTNIPAMASISRGDTYYVADGNYVKAGTTVFDKATDGTSAITFKKATASDHGVAVDWDAGYGDGEAVFGSTNSTMVWQVRTGYWTFDGAFGGDPGVWTDTHGFRLYEKWSNSNSEGLLDIGDASSETELYNVTASHIYFDVNGPGTSRPRCINVRGMYPSGIEWTDSHESHYEKGVTNFTVDHCWFGEGSPQTITTVFGTNFTFEYNYFEENYSDTSAHGTAWMVYGTWNVIFRYNWVRNTTGTAMLDMKTGRSFTVENWKVYGNVFFWEPDFEDSLENTAGIGPVYGAVGEFCRHHIGVQAGGITAITKANPAQITLSHWPVGLDYVAGASGTPSFHDGDTIGIEDVGGMTSLNHQYFTVSNSDFHLATSSPWGTYGTFTIDCDTSAYPDYTSGGYVWTNKWTDGKINGLRFYNNTIVHVVRWVHRSRMMDYKGGIQTYDGNDNDVKNNLWYDCGKVYMQSCNLWVAGSLSHGTDGNDLQWDYGVYADAPPYGFTKGTNDQVVTTAAGNVANPFKGYPAGDGPTHDFSLDPNTLGGAAAKDRGYALDAEYNTDMFGHTRGSDGGWDIGAIEFQEDELPAGNNAPVLAAIGNKTVAANGTVSFTATADPTGGDGFALPAGICNLI